MKAQQHQEEEEKDKASKEKPNILEIPSNEESGSKFEIVAQGAEMELEAELVAANMDATSMEGERREVVEEQELEEGEQHAMETSVPTLEHIYSSTVSSQQSTPFPIYSTIATTSVPPNLVPISDAMTDIFVYAIGIRPSQIPCNNQRRKPRSVCKPLSPV